MNYTPSQALVAHLAVSHGGSGTLGKKAVQKYIHILSSLAGRSFGYEFSFYTYGPFSRELASDLDFLAATRAIDVAYDGDAYSITATASSEALARSLPKGVRDTADKIWSKFAGRTAKQLELISTILFVTDEETIALNSNVMTDRVRALKPKYSISEVRAAQSELSSLDLS